MCLQDLCQLYHVEFLFIYIREAHPIDGWSFAGGLTEWAIKKYSPQTSTSLADPTTIEERQMAARKYEQAMHHGARVFVDHMDDAVAKAYAALPTRLYLVGMDGHVVYAGGLGPQGFRPKELQKALDHLVTKERG